MARRPVFTLLVVLCRATPGLADTSLEPDDEPGYSCGPVSRYLRAALADAGARPLQLTAPPRHIAGQESAGERCPNVAALRRALTRPAGPGIQRAHLGGHAAAARLEGPAGSGRYWEITLLVELAGAPLGACLMTTTTGFRNVYPFFSRHFPTWDVLRDGAMLLWTTIHSRPGGSLSETLILPLVYRLDGRRLVLDRPATLREIARFGRIYRAISDERDDQHRRLHRAAAAAYLAFAEGKACAEGGAAPKRP